MSKGKMVIYASIGSVISVLIWSFVGGCHSPVSTTERQVQMEAPVPYETEEELAEEGILPESSLPSPTLESELEEAEKPEAPGEETEEVFYTVQKGDTLWSISRHYGVSIDRLQEVNQITDADVISVGQKLLIPR